MAYELADELFLWWLGEPERPAPVGTLRYAHSIAGVSLQYEPSWVANGFPLSEDLPLAPEEKFPQIRETAVGAIDDARPDRWGERVIRFIDKPPRLSILEFLYFAGDERFGALGVSTVAEIYQPKQSTPLPRLSDVEEICEVVRKVEANDPVPEDKRRLIAPGTTLGGARPKALVEIDGLPWVVKFAETGEATDAPLIEHATLTLAEKAGMRVARTRALPLSRGHAVAVLRFDRAVIGGKVRRIHAQSANVALRAEGSEPGYPELAQLLRRRARVETGGAKAFMRELFRRMVFNIWMDNTDDHEKNHVLLMDDAQYLSLAPAFDVLPTGQGLGYQQMRVGERAGDSTIENALSEVAQFGMTRDQAIAEVQAVARVCATWKTHFVAKGVEKRDIESLERFIDRGILAAQRDAYL
ncbi:MAG: HipA domain-containing protein [Betaproteobacteria bacterium]